MKKKKETILEAKERVGNICQQCGRELIITTINNELALTCPKNKPSGFLGKLLWPEGNSEGWHDTYYKGNNGWYKAQVRY